MSGKATSKRHRFIKERIRPSEYQAATRIKEALDRAIHEEIGEEIRNASLQIHSGRLAGSVPDVCFGTSVGHFYLTAPLDALLAEAIDLRSDATHPEDIAYVEYLRGILAACRKKWRLA